MIFINGRFIGGYQDMMEEIKERKIDLNDLV